MKLIIEQYCTYSVRINGGSGIVTFNSLKKLMEYINSFTNNKAVNGGVELEFKKA